MTMKFRDEIDISYNEFYNQNSVMQNLFNNSYRFSVADLLNTITCSKYLESYQKIRNHKRHERKICHTNCHV